MVTDQQVRRLMKLMDTERTLESAAAKAGMSERTARKYLKGGRLPSEEAAPHVWRTREDPFEDAWKEVEGLLEVNPGLQAKTLFEYLERKEPGRYSEGQLRTLQRKIRQWRAVSGPSREVMFPQVHEPGALCASDFCHMDQLGVTIGRRAFPHLLYHFVLTYSNWETGAICFSESFESLSEGLQRALWELGGVPERHRTDRLGAAVRIDPQRSRPPEKNRPPATGGLGTPGALEHETPKEEFHRRYQAVLDHYGLVGEKIQARQAHENGDCEQRHHRFRTAVDQALMLRGSREFDDRAGYERFLGELFEGVNRLRRERFQEEKARLRPLPVKRLDACTEFHARVGPSSTIRVQNNTYSLASRLIGERVTVKLYADRLEVSHGTPGSGAVVRVMPRLSGRGKARIDYRDVIGSLVKKPGAFRGYRYREELFPTSRFRMAYDRLVSLRPLQADREYLRLLQLSATESEAAVEEAIEALLTEDRFGLEAIRERVEATIRGGRRTTGIPLVTIHPVDLSVYDGLIGDRTGEWIGEPAPHEGSGQALTGQEER